MILVSRWYGKTKNYTTSLLGFLAQITIGLRARSVSITGSLMSASDWFRFLCFANFETNWLFISWNEMVKWKRLLGVIFFVNKLLLQPCVVFDSESNGCNFSSLAPPGHEKKLFSIFFTKCESESKTTSGCSNKLFSKKITPYSLFSFYQ